MTLLRSLLACLLLAAGVDAVEPAEPVAGDGAAREDGGAVTAAPAPAAAEPVQDAPADDRFKPSEKISEDLSVSFPADI